MLIIARSRIEVLGSNLISDRALDNGHQIGTPVME